jgi:hypothetical protein
MPDGDREFEDTLMRRVMRSRPGYRAFCATVDLLGMTRMLDENAWEAMHRLNDLQSAFVSSTLFFPGDGLERACFAGDSWFFVREVGPDEDVPRLWESFCGRLFALVSFAADMEREIGNPGLRVIASHGRLVQVIEPDSCRQELTANQTRNWFVLTGAAEGLVKCMAAERAGRQRGFAWGQFWHEKLDAPMIYSGSPLAKIEPRAYGQPTVYPLIYSELCARDRSEVKLQPEFLRK